MRPIRGGTSGGGRPNSGVGVNQYFSNCLQALRRL